jgi:divalent metal cation (Fe/Co/Zn/Cd) transporter
MKFFQWPALITVLHSHEIAHAVKDNLRVAMPNVNDDLVHIELLETAVKEKEQQ